MKFALYDLRLHEKTSPRLTNVGSKDHVSASEPVSDYKIKDLIYSTQEYDKQLLEIGSNEQLKFSLSKNKEEFDRTLERAKAGHGIVSSNLANRKFTVTGVPLHDFKGTFVEAKNKAHEWAKKNLVQKDEKGNDIYPLLSTKALKTSSLV